MIREGQEERRRDAEEIQKRKIMSKQIMSKQIQGVHKVE